MTIENTPTPIESNIESLIYTIRGQKIMLDADLAMLYEVDTGSLNRAVKRNVERFPDDFMLQVTEEEYENLKCQIGISSSWGGRRRSLPYAFTEHGVAMLSSVLKSKKAVQVNIAIMRAFSRLRYILISHSELSKKLDELERVVEVHDKQIQTVFDAIRQLIEPKGTKRKEIGFHVKDKLTN